LLKQHLGAIHSVLAADMCNTSDALQVEAPPMFPPTFLYTQSWEDPRPDMQVRCSACVALELHPDALERRPL
jgi:hypothetical protein